MGRGETDAVRVPEVCAHIDWKTLLSGLHDQSLCELSNGIPLPVDTVRRLCCEATIVPILLGPDGTPVDCGRELRSANRKQRHLLRAMYRTCAHSTATCHSSTATSTTSSTGWPVAAPISTTSYRCAAATTISSTKVAGHSA